MKKTEQVPIQLPNIARTLSDAKKIIKKKFFPWTSRPVHVIIKSDKLDYLQCPRKEFFFDNFFNIEQGPSNDGKLNWDLLGFFSFIFSLTWGV